MKKRVLLLPVILFYLLSGNIYGQKKNECKDFHKSRYCWIPDSYDFRPYFKSKSAQIEINKVYKYEVVLTPKKDYKIGVCTYPGYEPVRFVIIDKETEQIIYDNSNDQFMESVGFTVDEMPMTVTMEITVLATDLDPKDMKDVRACVGIQILYQRVMKDGF